MECSSHSVSMWGILYRTDNVLRNLPHMQSRCEGIFYKILSVPRNIVMALNNVMLHFRAGLCRFIPVAPTMFLAASRFWLSFHSTRASRASQVLVTLQSPLGRIQGFDSASQVWVSSCNHLSCHFEGSS